MSWAVGLTLAIYCVGGVSGAHLNPVVTLVLMVTHKFPVKDGLVYIAGQFLGAFIAAAMVYVQYIDSINAFDTQLSTTQGIFATYPTHSMTIGGAFGVEVIATMVLVIGVYVVSDEYHQGQINAAVTLGVLLLGIGASMGQQTGYALNPARDLSPRLFTYAVGYGSKVWYFPVNNKHYSGRQVMYWWIPVFGPLVGAFLGALVYIMFVGAHWDYPDTYEVEENNVNLREPGVERRVENRAYNSNSSSDRS